MAKIDFRTYLKLEKALASTLKAAWLPTMQEAYAAMERYVNAGDFALAYKTAHELDCSALGVDKREFIKYNLLACINYGAAMAAGDSDTVTSLAGHETLLNRVADGFAHTLEYNVTIQAVKAAVQSIAAAEVAYKAAQKAEGSPRFLRPFVEFKEPTDSMLQLVSSLNSSRLATWGFTAEAEILGFETYQLSSVLDGRTSDFCRMINGKVFRVADARQSIVALLALQNPDDAKSLQPWPKQDKESMSVYTELTTEQLTQKGLHIPPFHPHCRTILVRMGKQPRLNKPEGTPATAPGVQVIAPSKATKETFTELGLEISDTALDHWNAYIGVSPVAVLAKLTGLSPDMVLAGALGDKFRSIVIAANGDILLSLKGLLGKSGKYGANAVIDPYTGTIYPDYLTFKNASPERAAEFFKQFYGGLLDVGASMGATEIVTQVAGETGVYLHAQAGFVPSPGAWSDLQEQLVIDVAEGGKYAEAFATLQPEQQSLITKLLADQDTEALYVLANLPFTAGGTTIGKLLTQNLKMEMSLNLDNAAELAKATKVFKS